MTMLMHVLTLLAVLSATVALAEQRPLPVPQTSAGCPPGYSSSPTTGFCTPNPGTRSRAVPMQGSTCPPGFSVSPTSRMCIETGNQSR